MIQPFDHIIMYVSMYRGMYIVEMVFYLFVKIEDLHKFISDSLFLFAFFDSLFFIASPKNNLIVMAIPGCGFSEDGKTRNFRPWNSVLFLCKANITASLSYKHKSNIDVKYIWNN